MGYERDVYKRQVSDPLKGIMEYPKGLFNQRYEAVSYTHLDVYKRQEQDYYEHYNKTKDAAIKFIQSTKGYERFNNMDMAKISKRCV